MNIERTTTDRPSATTTDRTRGRGRRLLVPIVLAGLVMTTAVGCCGC
jgi:hypothetical protein